MPIVIKEIRVNTVVEKKVLLPDEMSEQVYIQLKERIVEELSERDTHPNDGKGRKKER